LQIFTTIDQTVLYPANVDPMVITILDSSLAPIENARVRVTATATAGGFTNGDVILTGLTNALGQLSGSIEATANVPVLIRARKSTTAPFYKPSDIPSTFIMGSGLNTTLVLVADQ
jgi:hypothetical protein